MIMPAILPLSPPIPLEEVLLSSTAAAENSQELVDGL